MPCLSSPPRRASRSRRCTSTADALASSSTSCATALAFAGLTATPTCTASRSWATPGEYPYSWTRATRCPQQLTRQGQERQRQLSSQRRERLQRHLRHLPQTRRLPPRGVSSITARLCTRHSRRAHFTRVTPTPTQGMGGIADLGWGIVDTFGKVTSFARNAKELLAAGLPAKETPAATATAPSVVARVLRESNGELPVEAREQPLSADELIDGFDMPQGSISKAKEMHIKGRIFKGGVSAGIRHEVWKFMLGEYPWSSTAEERERIRKDLADRYYTMKRQWATLSKDQIVRNTKFWNRARQVAKDVVRTDRAYPFYGDGPEAAAHLQTLAHVLLTYTNYNFDLGYVQGMNDLASVVLEVMRGDEVDGFWCFKGLMDRVEANFSKDQAGMTEQLAALSQIVAACDPPLYERLRAAGTESMLFCFRWLLLHFKREFSFDTVKTLWEVAWSHPTPCFHLFVAAAVVLYKMRPHIMGAGGAAGFDELMEHANALSDTMALEPLLTAAERVYCTFLRAGDRRLKERLLGGNGERPAAAPSAHEMETVLRLQRDDPALVLPTQQQ
eukprot:TRINITY_DN4138_c0_g1_i2.p1 TRINITY_DN4138_c0_g1~~TRINITY_DN4138_c0_g1_i2.p1  ORF type:complete len:560 (-),score=100.36 TRINITY_DN4138_c0_g1_i2:68-1747(-)